MENATTFGLNAEAYASSRPTYPAELFQWIANQSPRKNLAWDVGAGSGQAALALSAHFARVHATDIDADQIAQAPAHASITYATAPAHASGLPDQAVDAITAATALHWFDHLSFWQELRRVARRGALFCGWTYHSARTDPDVQKALIDPLTDILDPYWSEGNRLSWRGYTPQDLHMPFEPLCVPEFACHLHWTPVQIAAFIRSWSAYRKAELDGHADLLADIETRALARLGPDRRPFILPLHCIAARIE